MATTADMEYVAFEEKVRRTVYLDKLSPKVTEAVLKTALGQFGDVASVHFIPNYMGEKNVPLCALVEMETSKQAESIVSEITNFPFMMVGMPRPVRARAAIAEMFSDRPKKPGRQINFRWVGPEDSDYEVARGLKYLVKKHAREDSYLTKLQLEEEERLARQQEAVLRTNAKKLEMMDKVMADGTLNSLASWYGTKITVD